LILVARNYSAPCKLVPEDRYGRAILAPKKRQGEVGDPVKFRRKWVLGELPSDA